MSHIYHFTFTETLQTVCACVFVSSCILKPTPRISHSVFSFLCGSTAACTHAGHVITQLTDETQI